MVQHFKAFILLVLLSGLTAIANADTVHLKCTADTNVSSYASEQGLNYGKSSRLRLKGIEMMALFQFDTAPIANWTVKRAALYLRYAGAERKLRTIGISTISAPWTEGTGAAEAKPGETCFLRNGPDRWAGPQTDFTDVSFTAGNTLASYADITVHDNDWISVPVDVRLVQAMIAGATYGLAVSDEKGQTMANNDVYSREQSGSEPYLVVEGSRQQPEPPNGRCSVTIKPDSAHADFQYGAISLSIDPPAGVFSYNIVANHGIRDFANFEQVHRASIPFATPGKLQTFHIDGLYPKAPFQLLITPVGVDGSLGKKVDVSGMASSAKLEPVALRRQVLLPNGNPRDFNLPARGSVLSERGGLAREQLNLAVRGSRFELGSGQTLPPFNPPLREPELDMGSGLALLPPKETVRVWAVSDTEKVSPVSGNVLESVGARDYDGVPNGASRVDSVWDGSDVRLYGARNEVLGFQLVVEGKSSSGKLHSVTVSAGGMYYGEHSKKFEPKISLYREWYVNDKSWFPEACIPLLGPFEVPAVDNKVPDQRNQSVFVDLQIPENALPGGYSGSIVVSAGGGPPLRIPVTLYVNELRMPNTLSFDISLNAYGTFGGLFGLNDNTAEYRAIERDYHRMAYSHRSTLAQLGYSHSGNITTNYAPQIEGVGAAMHVTDWSGWDRQFGAYLDGSAFADLGRHGVPIGHLYLPFHEAWPVDIRKHYAYTQTVFDYPAMITEHAMKAEPIEEATDQELRDGFKAIAAQFAAHFREKGWTHTMFQFYQNDKYYYKDPKEGGRGTSWWLLDEPNHRDDWLVLAYFDRLFQQGIGKSPGVTLVRREDVSRPQWQRDYLDGLVDLMCVSGELYTKGPRLREMQEKLGVKYWNYGSANSVNRPNTETEAWAIRAWLAGADAIVPWQSIGEDKNFEVAEDTALLLPGTRFGIHGPIASLRLKALRRAQQDVEYLVLLAKQKGWDREQVGAALRDILSLKVTTVKADDNDAGSYQFGNTRADDFDAMRRAVGAAVSH